MVQGAGEEQEQIYQCKGKEGRSRRSKTKNCYFFSSFISNFQILLVGTKSDLKGLADQRDNPDDTDITKAEGDQLAKEIKATCYMETSSKTGDGIKEVFDAAIKAAMVEGNTNNSCCVII